MVHGLRPLRQGLLRLQDHLLLPVVRVDAPDPAGIALLVDAGEGVALQGLRKVQRHGDDAPEIPPALFIRQKHRQPPGDAQTPLDQREGAGDVQLLLFDGGPGLQVAGALAVHVQPQDALVPLQGKDALHGPAGGEQDVPHVLLPQQDVGDPLKIGVIPAGLEQIRLQHPGLAHLGEQEFIGLRADGAGDVPHAVPLLPETAPLHAPCQDQADQQGQHKGPSGMGQCGPLGAPGHGTPSPPCVFPFSIRQFVPQCKGRDPQTGGAAAGRGRAASAPSPPPADPRRMKKGRMPRRGILPSVRCMGTGIAAYTKLHTRAMAISV